MSAEATAITLTVCSRSGQLPHECGLSSCENGCRTVDLDFVPRAPVEELVAAARRFYDVETRRAVEVMTIGEMADAWDAMRAALAAVERALEGER